MSYADPMRVHHDVIQMIAPPSREPLSEAALRLLYVDQAGTMAKWAGHLTPYMFEPMNCLQSRRFDGVAYVGPARGGKTVALVDGFLAHTVAQDHADTLVVQISQDKAAEFSKKRLSRAFEASPEVRAKLSTRGHDNNVHDIKTATGHFIKVGWPSKNIFASSDWRRVLITDYDRIDLDIGGEGSAWILAGKRTQTFMSSGMVMAESSPGYPVTDLNYRPATIHEAPPAQGIFSLYNEGDRRLLFWPCPHCGEYFEADFHHLVYDDGEKDPARASREVLLCCPHCGSLTPEAQQTHGRAFKLWANSAGLWVPEHCRVEEGRIIGDPRETRIASFWQKGVSAAFQDWNQLVYRYLSAMAAYEQTGDTQALKATVNVDQGRPFYPPRVNERSGATLADRRRDLGVKVVPPWVRFLLASVDVQGGRKTSRFEVMVRGFGPGLESVVIDRFKIERSARIDPESPDKFVRVDPAHYLEDWDLLIDKVIRASYEIDDGSGRRMPVYRVACDSNGEDGTTAQAYKFWRSLRQHDIPGLQRRFVLIKGRANGPMVETRYPDSSGRKDRKSGAAGDVPVLFIHTDHMKDVVNGTLGRETPGDRYCWFPDWLPESFFDELTAEERLPSGKWEKLSARNESWDLMVYDWALLHQLKAERITDWDSPPFYALPIDENPEIITPGAEQTLPKRRRRASS